MKRCTKSIVVLAGVFFMLLILGAKELNCAGSENGKALVIYPWEPISSVQVLPFDSSIQSSKGNQISINACRGEFEPTSFIIRALKPIEGIQIEIKDIINPDGDVIQPSAIETRLVKCWYQAGKGTVANTKKKFLVPELLLKDDKLIKVDYKLEKNYLRVVIGDSEQYFDISSPESIIPESATFGDSEYLKPFDMSANTNQQIWITLRAPEKAKEGKYVGKIFIKSSKELLAELTLEVNIFPFDLEAPILEYALYYRGLMTTGNTKGVNSELKTPVQYRIEMKNMRDHGISHPTMYQEYDVVWVPRCLKVREELGFPIDKLYVLGLGTGNSSDPLELRNLSYKVNQWRAMAKAYGYKDIFVYGIDEANGNKLLSQAPAWKEVHNAGAKIFVACSSGAVNLMGDLLDVAVLHGVFDDAEVLKWHNKNKIVLSYSNPQVGIEDPMLYRNNYGFKLLSSGYDGAMDYAYQHGFREIWNDFDHNTYRDHVFAYPTSQGVIDTIQWEGFREAVDDVRYASTMANKTAMNKKDLLIWIKNELKNNDFPDKVRKSIISVIKE